MEICVLASGSKANSIYIHDDETGILIDAGLSRKETLRRLEEKGLGGKPIDAILITHEHSDHIRGLNPV
ncbi:MAG: MBL fold metallo-hydrolase, partial [Candidatus Aureabacteria bacterium]|nr:MBL fold metallo-hydrolase [Candidatus Auribacterota bacterium]